MLLPREASALFGEEGAKGYSSVPWVPGVQAPGPYFSSPTKHGLTAWPVSALAKREAARSAAHHRGQAGRTSVEQQQDQSPQWLSAADSPLCLPHRRADGVGFLRGPMWVGESGVTLPRLAV